MRVVTSLSSSSSSSSCMRIRYSMGVVVFIILLAYFNNNGVSGEINTMTGDASRRHSRENEANGYGCSLNNKEHCDGAEVSLEDYRAYDPSPSSKASVIHGPIEHGTPVLPYIPSPNPSPSTPSGDQDDSSPGPSISI